MPQVNTIFETRLSLAHNGAHYINCTEKQLLGANVPQSVIDQALAGEHLKQIKSECGRRIYAIASRETQMNIATIAAVIGGKNTSARSTAEVATLTAAGMATDWVAAMRANIATLGADASVDYTADTSWPTCPPEVMALAAQF